jgi:hypothetical protein
MEDFMVEGFWIVQFEGVQGGGGGVVLLSKNKVLGGDSGYIYTGSYDLSGNALKAKVKVEQFLSGIPNVLGVVGNFELELTGIVNDNLIKGNASLATRPGLGLAVKLTRRALLP